MLAYAAVDDSSFVGVSPWWSRVAVCTYPPYLHTAYMSGPGPWLERAALGVGKLGKGSSADWDLCTTSAALWWLMQLPYHEGDTLALSLSPLSETDASLSDVGDAVGEAQVWVVCRIVYVQSTFSGDVTPVLRGGYFGFSLSRLAATDAIVMYG